MVIFPTWDLERSHDKKPSKNIRRLKMEFHINTQKKPLVFYIRRLKRKLEVGREGRRILEGKKRIMLKKTPKKPQKQTGFEVI